MPEADYLRGLDPAPAAPILFACWQTLEGTSVCRTLHAATAALATSLDGSRFDPCGDIDCAPVEAALADAIPELCHPSGYQLTGIGLAAVGDGTIALDAWTAQESGRARAWQRHGGGAEAQGRIEPDDHALFDVPEAGLLAVLERLRARATGTAPVLPKPAAERAGTHPEPGTETAADRLARLLCRQTIAGIAEALTADDEEYLHTDLLRAVNELDRHDAVIAAELARLDEADRDRAAGKWVRPQHADPARVAEVEAAFAGREAAWARLRDLLIEIRPALTRQR
jgi:hypothetical protein